VGSYYYLVAQLPALSYGQPSPMTSPGLRELCRELMTTADAALLDLCVLDPFAATATDSGEVAVSADSSPLISGWLAWERSLRLALAKFRGQKLKRDISQLAEPSADALDAIAVAKAAVAIDSPLEAELFLDRARWDAVEQLQNGNYFDRDTVYGYMFKLLLLERKALFRVEEGFAEYKAIYASVMEAALNSIASGEPK
jgi:hypothetical protein